MRPTISLSAIPHFPITAGTGLLALIATLFWWNGGDISLMRMGPWAWHGEPWRLLTATLLHGGFFHLFFNLFWHWHFGSMIEKEFGPAFLSLVLVAFAIGSSAAQYAIGSTSVGLSGVGYGLFGFLWILSKNSRYRDMMDQPTTNLFLIWFGICFVLDWTGVMNVANTAHASGLLLGALLGGGFAFKRAARALCLAGLSFAFAFIVWAATIGRPHVMLYGTPGEEYAILGYEALSDREDPLVAISYFEHAVQFSPDQADWWYDLGIAHARNRDEGNACAAFAMAYRLAPSDPDFSIAAKQCDKR